MYDREWKSAGEFGISIFLSTVNGREKSRIPFSEMISLHFPKPEIDPGDDKGRNLAFGDGGGGGGGRTWGAGGGGGKESSIRAEYMLSGDFRVTESLL